MSEIKKYRCDFCGDELHAHTPPHVDGFTLSVSRSSYAGRKLSFEEYPEQGSVHICHFCFNELALALHPVLAAMNCEYKEPREAKA